MKRQVRVLFGALAALIAVALLLPPGAARATVARALDLPELVARADHVVVATALGRSSRWDRFGRIVSDITLEVEQDLKGRLEKGERVEVTVLGGTVGNLTMTVAGAARMRTGERAVVFLRDAHAPGKLRTVGMGQGVIRLAAEPDTGRMVVLPGAGPRSLLVGQESKPGPRDSERTAEAPALLDDLLAEIRRLLASSGGR